MNERVRQDALDRQPTRRPPPGGPSPRHRAAHVERPRKKPSAQRRRRRDRFEDPGLHLLVDARHACHDRRAYDGQVPADGLDRLGKGDPHPAVQVQVDDHPLEAVAERKERHGDVVPGQLQDLARGEDVRHEVAVRQHDAFRLAGRAGRVDDGGQIVWRHRLDPPVPHRVEVSTLREGRAAREPFAPGRGARSATLDGRYVVERHDVLDAGQTAANGLQLGRLPLVRNERDAGAAVGQDVLDLLGGQCRIDRHGDTAGREDGEVRQLPLRPGLCGDRHPIAGLEPRIDQGQAHASDGLDVVPGGEIVGPAGPAPADDGVSRVASRHQIRKLGQGPEG